MTSVRTSSWLDGISRSLIHRAARAAPEPLSARLEEEWLADLEARPGVLARLRLALGCAWAGRVIAYDQAAAGWSARRAASAGGGVLELDSPGSSPFSRRTLTLLLVIGLHAAVLYGVATEVIKVHKADVPDVVLDPFKPAPPRPPLPNVPRPTTTVWRLSPPEIPRHVGVAPETPTLIDSGPPQLPPGPPGTHEAHRVTGGPGAGFPSTDDFYPSMSIFRGERGIATVQVCVDPKGRLTSAPSIVASTGSARLDEGALKLAKAGSGHYRATTEDGSPVSACYAFRIRFDLKG
ncbi:MAG TPA: energy transducer TonB [Steroidobacteraceae bacterium]|jgi:TonB family protein|nr:energy transducer TonB [Steroidobacteraceae bacterium]